MIIDFHTHVFPDELAPRAMAKLKGNMKKCHGIDFQPASDGTMKGLLSSMEDNGIDQSVILPIATKPEQTPVLNAQAAAINQYYNGKVLSFGTVYPGQEDLGEVLDELCAEKIAGIKLHPEFQNADLDSKKMIQVLEEAEKRKLYSVIHMGGDLGFMPPSRCNPKMLRHVLEYVSGEYIIAAHMGGWGMWEDVMHLLAGTKIWMDTSMVAAYIDPNLYRSLIEKHGADRILFGSDSPWESPKKTKEVLFELGLTEEEKEKICWKNAEKILKN